MEPLTIGYLGFAAFVALILLRAPIAYAMAIVGTLGLLTVYDFAAIFKFVPFEMFSQTSSFTLASLPLFLLIAVQELFVSASATPFPATSPASIVFFAVVAMLFFSIAVHCVRHRHMFIEMTNLRELLEPRVDPGRGAKAVGRVAFDS